MPIDGATLTCPSEKDLLVEQSEKCKVWFKQHGSVYMLDGSEALEVYPSITAMQAIWTKEMILIFVFPNNRVACMTGKCMLPVQRKEGHACVCVGVLTAYSFLLFSASLSLSLSLSLRHSSR